jgi:hypothetical protein
MCVSGGEGMGLLSQRIITADFVERAKESVRTCEQEWMGPGVARIIALKLSNSSVSYEGRGASLNMQYNALSGSKCT